MAKLKWDQTGDRLYETGVKKGVLFVMKEDGSYDKGVAWNGLTGVTESPSGAEATALYANDEKYLELRSNEEFGATIEAYTYPDEFAECDGSAEPVTGMKLTQQTRKKFALCYRTTIGNDAKGNDYGYKLHIIYGCTAAPSEKEYATINDSPEAITFSWEVSTTPVAIGDVNGKSYKPTAHIEIDSTKFTEETAKAKLASLEDKLYGTDGGSGSGTESELLLPNAIITMLSAS